MAPTVRPTDWGLISEDGRRLGLRMEAVERLRALEGRAALQGAQYFGAALHEHDLCPEGSLEPRLESMEALAAYLDERVRPALDCAPITEERPLRSSEPLSDRRTYLVRQVRSALGAGRGGVEMIAHRARRSAAAARRRGGRRLAALLARVTPSARGGSGS